MPVIRWLFNHLVIVFLAVLIILGAFYQDRLEKELTDFGVLPLPNLMAKFKAATNTTMTESKPAATTEMTADTKTNTPASEQMPTHLTMPQPTDAAPTPAPSGPVSAPSGPVPTPSSSAPAPAAPAPAQMQANAAPTVSQNFPAQGFQPQFQGSQPRMPQQFNRPPARQVYVQPPQLDDKVKETWIAARTAFWQRDMKKAEELYKKLVADSGEADAAGELGNVYLMQRKTKEAAEMYYQAAQLHLKGDNPMMAASVVGPLSRLAPEKAQDVRQKIMALQAEMSGQAPAAN